MKNSTANKEIKYLNGLYEVKLYNGEICRFHKEDIAKLFLNQMNQVESNFKNIKQSLELNHGIVDVRTITVNDFEEDGAVFVLSGVLKDAEVLIELWAKDYCIDVYPKDSNRWDETIFHGTLVGIEDEKKVA